MAEDQERLDIKVIPLSVSFPDESFRETEVKYDYFYQKIEASGTIPTSSQPPQGEIEQVFTDVIAEGHDIIAIFLSSAMSGTYQSALSVKDHLKDRYPEARIEIIDSRTNCMAMGLIVLAAAQAVRAGRSLDEAVQTARGVMQRIRFYFVPAGLEYLKKGGRIGGAAALVGSLLQIKPILYVNQGKTALLERTRGTQAAIRRMLSLLDNDRREYGLEKVLIHHIFCQEKAEELANIIKTSFGLIADILPIGPVIGLHVGPGTLGIVYVTEN
jgi:EDD domain protein, DegV family